jgi:peptidoglycan/LPS O-acetylase OafA/YrhL
MHPRSADRIFFHSLDGIRAIAALMVVLLHTAPLFGIARPQEGYLAVDLFFVLSGVVICHTYEQRLLNGMTARRFAWVRAVRLYPLYIAGTVLGAAGILAFGGERGSPGLAVLAPLALVVMPYLGTAAGAYFPLNIPAWSLILEFVVNLFYAGIVRRLDRRRLVTLMALSFLGLVICVRLIRPHSAELGWKSMNWHGVDLGMIGGVFRVGYSFFAGVLIYRHFLVRRVEGVADRVRAWVPWLIVVLVAIILAATPSRGLRPYYDLLIVTTVFPAMVYLALWYRSA